MDFTERVDNVYTIDTKMFGFDRYHSAYLVKGKEIALVDTGMADQLQTVRDGIKAHGFSPGDISNIFITHSHADHCGNVAPLLRECPGANVYIHPSGFENLTDPSIAQAIRKKFYSPEMFSRFTDMEPVPPSRIKYFNDGDIFDLGDGEKLKIIFAPGHQPDGVVILQEKNSGLFINDLVGNCLIDADAQYALNPPKSNPKQTMESLNKLLDVPVTYLYMGHYGICDKPKEVINRAIHIMQQLLEIGERCMAKGKPENIASEVIELAMPELEKLRAARGEALYQYASKEHVFSQAKLVAQYLIEELEPKF